MNELRIGLAQIDSVLGEPTKNLELHRQAIEQARQQQVQLLCFPELSLTGYMLKDLVPNVAMPANPAHPVLAPLVAASADLDLVFGFVEEDERHRYYIASAYCSGGHILHVHRKVYLTSYGLFEEGRFFAAGDRFRAFDTRYGRVGLLICEDFWHMSAPYALWMDGADLLLLMSASPGRGLGPEPSLETSRSVEVVNQAYAALMTAFVLHCNRAGFEDGVNFWGGSTVFGPDGRLVARAPYFESALLTATLDLNALRRVRQQLPLLRDERPELLCRKIERSRMLSEE
ncbi:MAG TPA: nitrilase-related carbon-nitrogen hydrolase [Anaerolineae bacterium]|nr:nitrilase-related carbon-nitrogen hydrolase [Anaerolineae bacterium]HNT04815.1 nitrilase-related carbon-nitrogen hydrolase [Anaerolineae bacterium]